MTNPLIYRYLGEMENMAKKLLRSGNISEQEVFEKIFHRRMPPNTSVLEEIQNIRTIVYRLYEANKKSLVKHQVEIPGILTRVASPQEVLKSTKTGTYNEIGIRTHLTCKDVHAAAPSFGGLVIERKTALVHGILRPEVAQILTLAKQLNWPILMV